MGLNIEKEYVEALRHMHKVCKPTDKDAKQINEWAKETFKKYRFKYDWPEEWK